jgi:transposase
LEHLPWDGDLRHLEGNIASVADHLRTDLDQLLLQARLSCNQAAKQFGVAVSTAIGWVRRLRETGSVAPGKMGGHRPKAISGEHRVWVLQRIKRDFTLRGLVAELAQRGLMVDYRSVWEFVHAEKLSFKKKRGGWRTRSSRRRPTTSPVDQISRSRRT